MVAPRGQAWLAALAAVVVAAGCAFDVDYGETRFRCQVAEDCPGKQLCEDGFCADPGAGEPPGADESPAVDESPAAVISFGENSDDDVGGVTSDAYASSAQPASNFGGADVIMTDTSPAKTALLRFDVVDLPDDAVAAELVLWTGKNALESGVLEVYAVTEAWLEGDNQDGLGVGNYDLRLPDVPWTTAGAGPGSRDSEVLAALEPREPHVRHVIPLPLDLVRRWADAPEDNHGLALVSNSTEGHGVQFRSSEADGDGHRPRLVVTRAP